MQEWLHFFHEFARHLLIVCLMKLLYPLEIKKFNLFDRINYSFYILVDFGKPFLLWLCLHEILIKGCLVIQSLILLFLKFTRSAICWYYSCLLLYFTVINKYVWAYKWYWVSNVYRFTVFVICLKLCINCW